MTPRGARPGMGGLMKEARAEAPAPRFLGRRTVATGADAVRFVETLAGAVGQPAGQHGRRAAAIAAGRSLSGARTALPASGQDLAAMHESLFAAAGKRLPVVVTVTSRAMTKQAISRQAGHDDYHAVDDAGAFQLFAHDAQAAADLRLVAQRIAELALTPGLVAQDAVLTSGLAATVRLPDAALAAAYLGDPADRIETPTPAQRLVYGDTRRRLPEIFDLDYPAMLGSLQDPDSYAQGVAAQRPFYFDHVAGLADRALAEYAELTGRTYARAQAYRLADADYVLVAQGSIVPTCQALCDHLRATERLRLGVLNVTMFRPFPADLVSRLLAGAKAVTVLERVDQPLAVDPPLLRELRATMSKAVENARAREGDPHPGIAACKPAQVPDFFSTCFGLGGRDAGPADLAAAVENMQAGDRGRRQSYLGIDFVRAGTRFPKLQVWQEQLVDRYPRLATLALEPAATPLDLRPPGTVTVRVLARTTAEATALGERLARMAMVLGGLDVRAHPIGPSEPDGPARFDLSIAGEPIRAGGEAERIDVAVAASADALTGHRPLDDVVEGGACVVGGGPDAWQHVPAIVRRTIGHRRLQPWASAPAAPETNPEPEASLIGAALKAAGLADRLTTSPGAAAAVADGLERSDRGAVERYLAALVRQLSDAVTLDPAALPPLTDEPDAGLPAVPKTLAGTNVQPGIGHGGRFWERVGALRALGQDGLADPFAALGALPAATSAILDMTATRQEVPELDPVRCTGCGECWVQCPDTAIPGVVTDVSEILASGVDTVAETQTCDRLRQILKPLAGETRRRLKADTALPFADALSAAYRTVADKLGLDPERRQALDGELAAVHAALADFPLARTERFFDAHEARAKGTGGLLSITIDPAACRGCGICVTACPEDALRMAPQTDDVVDTLRRNWTLWEHLPETHDRYVEGSEDPETLPALLLRQRVYRSMIGGDPMRSGSTEKTALHLVLSAVNAWILPRVARHVERLTTLIEGLDAKARELVAAEAPLDRPAPPPGEPLAVSLDAGTQARVARLTTIIGALKDLRWRYTEGPGGKGRASCGVAGAAEGGRAWSGVYPYNPYPVPWVTHLLDDAPSVALGLFDGQMQKMARDFAWVRRAELELADEYDVEEHEPPLAGLEWRDFTDDEFALCPPLLAVGDDEAIDEGVEHLSPLLRSGRPVRVIVLDREGAPEAGTSRRQAALLAMAHRQAFVLQSSPAAPSHLLGGLLRGLDRRRPALVAIHCPQVPGDGPDRSAATRAARLALESRAVPLVAYDPDAGPALADRISLDGNPALDEIWPSHELTYAGDDGADQVVSLPVTVADWAATEAGLAHLLAPIAGDVPDESLMRLDAYLLAAPDERAGRTPFIHLLTGDRRLGRLAVTAPLVALADDRLQTWRQLRQMAGLDLADSVRERVAAGLEADFARRLDELESRHRATLADMESRYPTLIARRLVAGLIKAAGDGTETVGALLRRAAAAADVAPLPSVDGYGPSIAPPPPPPADGSPAASPATPETAVESEETDESLSLEPYIQSALCTSCDECLNINKRMFAYDKKKQAYIKDATAGTYRELVMAAEKCPVSIIHPGTPLNPDEKDLDKWVAAAARFM